MKERDGGGVRKHVIDSHEHCLNGIDTLKLAEEIDIEFCILMTLCCEDSWSL